MTFEEFSNINKQRASVWHQNGIEEWSISDWFTALVGEIGEAGNLIKKYNRLRTKVNSNNPEKFDWEKLGDEIADSFIYLDLLATRCGFSLERIAKKKFNFISKRENLDFIIE